MFLQTMELVDTVGRCDFSPCAAGEAFDVAIGIAVRAINAVGEKVADRGLAGAHHAEEDNVRPGHVDTRCPYAGTAAKTILTTPPRSRPKRIPPDAVDGLVSRHVR